MRAVYNSFYPRETATRIFADHPDIHFTLTHTAEEVAAAIGDADIFIGNNRSYDAAMAEAICTKGKRLRWVQFTTAGNERAMRFGLPKGIPACYSPAIKGPTVAEHAMTLLLASYHRLRLADRAQRRHDWARFEIGPSMRTVEGQTLVIVGLGGIGQETARKAKAFDMQTIGVSRAGTPSRTIDEVVTRDRLLEVLPRADVLLMCCPVEPETIHMIGAAQLAAMKPTSLLVNVGRGELIDHDALVAALQQGIIGGAAIDVAEPEPLPPGHPLWDMDNVIVTPHISGAGKDGYERFKKIFDENLRRLRAGEPLLHRLGAS